MNPPYVSPFLGLWELFQVLHCGVVTAWLWGYCDECAVLGMQCSLDTLSKPWAQCTAHCSLPLSQGFQLPFFHYCRTVCQGTGDRWPLLDQATRPTPVFLWLVVHHHCIRLKLITCPWQLPEFNEGSFTLLNSGWWPLTTSWLWKVALGLWIKWLLEWIFVW